MAPQGATLQGPIPGGGGADQWSIPNDRMGQTRRRMAFEVEYHGGLEAVFEISLGY
jgi:hypothetical protein